MKVGFILAKWDETLGPETIAVYPKDFIDNPDLLAIQYFSSSQFIFGGEKFMRISFRMPLVYLGLDAILFFDYLEDESVRGGRHPILLILLYEQSIPRAIIDQYHETIVNRIDTIKSDFSNSSHIVSTIKVLHSNLLTYLGEFKPAAFQALKSSEQRFKTMFEGSRDAIFVFIIDKYIIVDANLQAETMINKTRDKIIGMTGNDLLIPDDAKRFMSLVSEHLKNKNSPPIITNIITADKKIIPVEINASIIEIGGKDYIQANFRDITKRRKAEILAKTMKLYAESVVETIRQPVIVLDAQYNVLSANFSFCETFKQLPGKIEHKSFYEIGRGMWNIPQMKSLLEDIITHQDQIDEYEVAHNFKGEIGHKVLLVDASRIENKEDQSEIIVLAFEDITHRKK